MGQSAAERPATADDVTALQADGARVCARLTAAFAGRDLSGRLAALRAAIDGRVVFTTSFGIEDQAIAHAIFAQRLPIDVVTLDTGRLFPQTYDVWAETERRYGVTIRASLSRSSQRRNAGRRAGHQWFPPIGGGAPSLLRRAQGRAVAARACRRRRLDHRPARRPIGSARRDDVRCRSIPSAACVKLSPLARLEPRTQVADYIAAANIPLQRTACQRLPFDRLRALHARGRAGRTGTRRPLVVGTGDKKECGLHTTIRGARHRSAEAARRPSAAEA